MSYLDWLSRDIIGIILMELRGDDFVNACSSGTRLGIFRRNSVFMREKIRSDLDPTILARCETLLLHRNYLQIYRDYFRYRAVNVCIHGDIDLYVPVTSPVIMAHVSFTRRKITITIGFEDMDSLKDVCYDKRRNITEIRMRSLWEYTNPAELPGNACYLSRAHIRNKKWFNKFCEITHSYESLDWRWHDTDF